MRVLLSSSYTDDRSLVEQARSRGVEFLQKPCPLEQLYRMVSGVISGASGTDSSSCSNLVALTG